MTMEVRQYQGFTKVLAFLVISALNHTQSDCGYTNVAANINLVPPGLGCCGGFAAFCPFIGELCH